MTTFFPIQKNIKQKLKNHTNGNNAKYKKRILNKEIKRWDSIINLLFKEKLNVLDIGAASGSLMLSLSKNNLLLNGTIVDLNFNNYKEEYLGIYGLDNDFYFSKNIKVMNCDGLDSSINFNCDLLIKTYNPAINWSDLLKKSNPKYIISDNFFWNHDQNYQIEYMFNPLLITEYDKTMINIYPDRLYPYYLIKRK